MKKIKVLVFGLSNNYGGIETYVFNSYKHMNRDKIQFDFIDTSSENAKLAYEDEYKKMNSIIYKITKRSIDWKKSNREIIHILKNNTYDFVHLHVMNYMWWEPITLAYKYTNAKIIVHSHNSKIDYNAFFKNIILDTIGRIKTRKINYLRLACGEAAGKYLFKDKNFKIMENGIEINKYYFNSNYRKEIRKEFHIDEKCTVFGHVGNFYVAKNYPKLLSIFQEYIKFNKNAKLLLIGNYNNDPTIKKRVLEMKLEKKVIFAGIRTDVNKIYSAFDIFLFPSFYEGLSISMIEAQISGSICYASNTIDENTKITDNVRFINIKEKSRTLAQFIFKDYSAIDRKNIKYNQSYDIVNSSKKLQKFYEEEI